MPTTLDPAQETDRVRRYTTQEMLHKIEDQIERNVAFYAAQSDEVIARRIEELTQEWSINRYLQLNVASAGFLSGVLALMGKKKWAFVTIGAFSFFLFHGIRGWDPPIPLLRRLGVRTRSEIDREIYALKVARGDFKDLPRDREINDQSGYVRSIMEAVNK